MAETGTEVESCRTCGAARPGADALWCQRCLERYDGRNRPAGGYAGPLRPAVVWSRTRAGATTMGLRGRVTVTAVIVLTLLTWFVELLLGGHVIALMLWWLPSTVIGAVVLHDVWRREKTVVRHTPR
jgi:hypothetical protein